MITNRQLIEIINKNDKYLRNLNALQSAKDFCRNQGFKDGFNKAYDKYEEIQKEYDQWLDSEVK